MILAAILILIGVQLWILGLVADLMAVNRKLLEDIQLRLRRWEIEATITSNPVMQSMKTEEKVR